MNEQNNNSTISLLDQALAYARRGWSVIPVGSDKKPLITWKENQSEPATEEQIKAWFELYPQMGLGIVTGKVSNLTVVDIDPRHGGTDQLFKNISTPSVKTGGGGFHYYFSYAEGLQNSAGIQKGIDIRGEGGYVIAPPSIHLSGEKYEWIKAPETIELAELPVFVSDWIKKPISKEKTGKNEDFSYLQGVTEGNRNEAAAKTAGVLLKTFSTHEWDTKAWPLLCAWNTSNEPPLPEDELRKVFESIREREEENEDDSSKQSSVAGEIVEAILGSDMVLFHDQYKKGFISRTGDGSETFPIKGDHFKKWLAGYVWTDFKIAASNDLISKISLILESHATFNGEQYHLETRICENMDAIWYDIGDGPAVRVTQEGYSIVSNPPILFKRYSHQSAQVHPMQGGDIKELGEFVNIRSETERLLFLVFTVASFIPGFPHPLLVLFGPQGAGKSTPLRMLKMLIDPSQLRTLSMSDSEREFVQLASHHYFLFFDNLSGLPVWMSDALARASTGDGFSKRELYSDDSDVIYSFQRTIGLNGINLVVEKADLLDRSILLGLQRIPQDMRREEKEFWKLFEERRPFILGSVFQTVSKAISIYPHIQLKGFPRMADFCRWGCAIAEAIGYTSQDFLDAYYANIASQNEAALEASPVGVSVTAFMDEKDESWEGTASELLEILEKKAEGLKIDTRQKLWPKDAAWLVKRLNVIVPNLEEAGIKYERQLGKRSRRISLIKVAQNTVATVIPSLKDKSDRDENIQHDNGTSNGMNVILDVTVADSGPSDKPTTLTTVKTVDDSKFITVNDLEQVKSEEELSKVSPVEREIYLEKFWNTTVKELDQLAEQKVTNSPTHK